MNPATLWSDIVADVKSGVKTIGSVADALLADLEAIAPAVEGVLTETHNAGDAQAVAAAVPVAQTVNTGIQVVAAAVESVPTPKP